MSKFQFGDNNELSFNHKVFKGRGIGSGFRIIKREQGYRPYFIDTESNNGVTAMTCTLVNRSHGVETILLRMKINNTPKHYCFKIKTRII